MCWYVLHTDTPSIKNVGTTKIKIESLPLASICCFGFAMTSYREHLVSA